ncbi:hypothetical protein ACFL2Q_18000 [Thermodesulfobacteriota bacterium]
MQEFHRDKAELSLQLKNEAFDVGEEELEEALEKLPSNLFMGFHPFQWAKLDKKFKRLYKTNPPTSFSQYLSDLEMLRNLAEKRAELRQMGMKARPIFGEHWRAEQSDHNFLEAFYKWTIEIRKLLEQGHLTHRSVEWILGGTKNPLRDDELTTFRNNMKDLEKTFNELCGRLGLDFQAIHNKQFADLDLQGLQGILDRWSAHLNELHPWCVFQAKKKAGVVFRIRLTGIF